MALIAFAIGSSHGSDSGPRLDLARTLQEAFDEAALPGDGLIEQIEVREENRRRLDGYVENWPCTQRKPKR